MYQPFNVKIIFRTGKEQIVTREDCRDFDQLSEKIKMLDKHTPF